MKPDKEILILCESLGESVVADVVTVSTLSAIIGLSVYVFESVPMQWVGAIIFFIWLLNRSSKLLKGTGPKTPQEAADYLSKEYGVEARK